MLMEHNYFPQWLVALLKEKFFTKCLIHEDVKKNVFCLDCCDGICPQCLIPHHSHSLLQIRRYVYHDVIRVNDAEEFIDCSSIQCYTVNRAKVIFLNERPQKKPYRGSSNICINCDRGLQHPFLFCSLYCKFQHIVRSYECKVSNYIYNCERTTFPEPGQVKPQLGIESGSSGSNQCTTISIFPPVYCEPISVMNRRKTTPHRSPLY